MKIACLGGGPAGTTFAILMKKAFPDAAITIYERNRPGDTFGWGVVFSDATLGNFAGADRPAFEAIQDNFVYWTDIDTFVHGQRIRSTGHGFCGMSRRKLLELLYDRCRALGIDLRFEHEVRDDTAVGPADLIVACDGVNSFVREKYKADFRPTVTNGTCRFTWLGTTLPLDAFTFIFRDTPHGLFQVHAYPFQRGAEPLSTWIVECHEDVWRRAGFDSATEAETCDRLTTMFAPDLAGHRLLNNRSLWRSFPTVACGTWRRGNLVLMGDAAHTAHFSIGSGTKLAMEDAIALAAEFKARGTGDVPGVLAAYEASRMVDTLKLQKSARTSRQWFEDSARYMQQDSTTFTFNLLTRSQRITWDNLKVRDPAFIGTVAATVARDAGVVVAPTKTAPNPMFTPFTMRGLTLANRVVVSPMCQYSAVDGLINDWHFVHLGSRAVGGAALVIAEATDVSAIGRITHGCSGIYNETHTAAWKRVVDFVHAYSPAKIGIQIAHAGRKGSCTLPWEGDVPLRDATAWQTLGPSAVPFKPGGPPPRAMTRADMDMVRDEFVAATRRAVAAGFDFLELHIAHGYLLSSFLSPKSNFRTDEYGGSLEKRMRYVVEVFAACRAAWPADRPLAARISASDWLDAAGGQTVADSVIIARALKAVGCDLIDVSSAGNTPESHVEYGRMYQVPFADRIRHEADIAVMAVGGIQSADHVNTIIAAGRADLCALARPHLSDPYFTMNAAIDAGESRVAWPNQYLAVKPR